MTAERRPGGLVGRIFGFCAGQVRKIRMDAAAAAKRCLRRAAHRAGGAVISKNAHELLLRQRSAAIAELTTIGNAGLAPGLTCVVFSRDRAMQLHALLETYFRHAREPVETIVLYRAGSEGHNDAYNELRSCFEDGRFRLKFARESRPFREELLEILAKIRTRNMFFLTDDDVLIRPVDFSLAAEIDPLRTVLSFRHSPNIRSSYTAGRTYRPPSFSAVENRPEVLAFRWFEREYEWSDPWSVNGQVLSTAEVLTLTRISEFKAPNSYERELKTFNEVAMNRGGMCYRNSVVVNLPINRVQSEVENKSGNISPEFLLEQWRKGLAIDTSALDGITPQATHEERAIGFKKRAGARE